ncbi:DUF4221 family protein [Algoriphagus halophytocola]|uniref:DUF4221 family protein n=1 Tax=Algoriphagus halophytocola TaxID=2991499 RepID=UPI0022DD9636|nr:DUF4221 family protein [Algoriphagus sp. TR-M9]WBL42850.1 DUF4221 family protein [Algoriphagus sp. TR-M9]
MNRILYLAGLLLLLSCSQHREQNHDERKLSFSYELDTLRVDSQNHLFNLAHNLPMVKLSPDGRYLYFFDDYNYALDKVDMISMKYDLSVPLEKEGPKGVGNSFDFAPKDDGTIQLLTEKALIKIDGSGNLLNASPVLSSIFDVEKEKQFFRYAKISSDQRFLFGLTSSIKQEQYLGWIDLVDSLYHEVLPDSMRYRENLKVDLGRLSLSGMFEPEYLNNRIVLYHDDGIDFYTLDPASRTWVFHDFSPGLIEKRKAGNYPNKGSMEDLPKILEMEKLEINYRRLVYDSKNKRYYRIASKRRENQTRGTVPNQYLLVFSEDFKLIHEEDMSDLPISLHSYFVREGKFWIRNQETEELEFLVFEFSLN